MRGYFIFLLLLSSSAFGQSTALVLGNHQSVYLPESDHIQRVDSLPANLDSVCCVFLFSNATSTLKSSEVDQLVGFLEKGGGLYLGADNWPLQSEANQLTQLIYGKEYYGAFESQETEINDQNPQLRLTKIAHVPAGQSTCAFPLDHRLSVEVWQEDQALVLTGYVSSGRVILDGGYSRFYAHNRSAESDFVLFEFLRFLRGF